MRGAELTESEQARQLQQPSGRRPGSAWWLVEKDGNCRTEVLTLDCGGEQALPVFSGEGEAEMFVWLGDVCEDGWRVRETSTGELVSMLHGLCANVRTVALDPSPEMAAAEIIGLVSVDRERFVDRIAAPGEKMLVPVSGSTGPFRPENEPATA